MTPENSAGGFRERLDDFEERLDDLKKRLDDSWKDNTEIPSGACKTQSPYTRYKAMSNSSVTSSPDQGMTLHRIYASLG